MSPAPPRRGRGGAAVIGALGVPMALAAGLALSLPATGAADAAGAAPPAAPGSLQAAPAGRAAGADAVAAAMVSGPIDASSLSTQAKLHKNLAIAMPPGQFSCTSPPLPTTSTTSTILTTTSSTTTSTTTSTTVPGPTTTLAPGVTTTTTTTLPSATSSSAAPTTTQASTSTTTPLVPPGEQLGYDLVESNGKVVGFGGVGAFGPRRALVDGAVGAAATVDGGGYWVLAANGHISRYGDAVTLGEPKRLRKDPAVGIVGTPSGQGYWVLTADGSIDNFGNAVFCGSPVHDTAARPFVAMAATPDGNGYFVVDARGRVYSFGDAPTLTLRVPPARRTIVAIAATPDGLGYWLLSSKGTVYAYGSAHNYGGGARKHGVGSFVSIDPTADGHGYWLVTSTGRVFQYGDASSDGSLVHHRLTPPLSVVAAVTAVVPAPTTPSPSPSTTTTTVPVPVPVPVPGTTVPQPRPTTTVPTGSPPPPSPPHGKFGYDISDFQCRSGSHSVKGGMPPRSGVSIIQVAGWLDSADNACLASEAAWATHASTDGKPFQLYLFMNSPDLDPVGRSLEASGPAGTCAKLAPAARPACIAYNYGYNGAVSALSYATSQGVRSGEWWLDVENDTLSSSNYSDFSAGRYWSHSTALNDQVLTGAFNALHRAGLLVGIYSTSVQWPHIAGGGYLPPRSPVPLWVAGVPWTAPPFSEPGLYSPSALASWCAGTANYGLPHSNELFAGGTVQLLQETPGTEASPYGLDPDYAC